MFVAAKSSVALGLVLISTLPVVMSALSTEVWSVKNAPVDRLPRAITDSPTMPAVATSRRRRSLAPGERSLGCSNSASRSSMRRTPCESGTADHSRLGVVPPLSGHRRGVGPRFSGFTDGPTLATVTSPVRLRGALDAVPAYRAGRPAPPGAYKISSNENPYPPLPSVRKVLEDAAGSVNRYPDFASSALVGALAQRFDVPPECLAVGTGSVGVLQQALQAVVDPGDEVVFAWRSFEAYPIVTQVVGGTCRPGAAARRREPRRRGDGGRRHAADPRRAGVQPQQPDEYVRPGG